MKLSAVPNLLLCFQKELKNIVSGFGVNIFLHKMKMGPDVALTSPMMDMFFPSYSWFRVHPVWGPAIDPLCLSNQ